jgi:hypothetical protein
MTPAEDLERLRAIADCLAWCGERPGIRNLERQFRYETGRKPARELVDRALKAKRRRWP